MTERDVKHVSSMYGGFWNFDFKDFCYMSNPYFPPAALRDALTSRLWQLIGAYPSTNRHLSSLVAKPLGLSADEVVVANGASELINAITRCFVHHLAVPVPTFEEYVNRARGQGKQVSEFMVGGDFELDVDAFIAHAQGVGANSVLLIRPNNPTGTMVPKDGVEHLLRSLHALDVVIIDESFIDFADDYPATSAQDMIGRYPNLVILRSMSKNYGVPGLRLGYAVSGNPRIVADLRSELPIWNINSMAQFFLEEVDSYRQGFLDSCQQVRHATQLLYSGLKELPHIHPYPTQGNYVLCRVTSRINAEELTARLFQEFRILVNDRGGKGGLDDTFFRLASRTVDENALLIGALRQVGAAVPAQSQLTG